MHQLAFPNRFPQNYHQSADSPAGIHPLGQRLVPLLARPLPAMPRFLPNLSFEIAAEFFSLICR